MRLNPITVKPDRLLLDPNNYRFHDLDAYKPVVSRRRYGEASVQTRAMNLLQSMEEFELPALKDSILTNGYVRLEQIVVEEYDQDDNGKRYLVVEGNRRVAAIRLLLDEYQNALITIPNDTLATLKKLPALEIEGSQEERAIFRQTLMAIRHVAGIREWGPYQQAKLIAELYEQEERQFGKVAQRVGIKAQEVGRRYRAIKALKQMEEDEEFGEYAIPKLYALFHEAISAPVVKKWLGWSDENFLAENPDARRAFYELLVPRTVDGEALPAKIKDVRQVRKLKSIVDKPLPLSILLDPERSLEDAENAAQSEIIDEVPGVLEHALAQAVQSLSQPSIDAWLNPTERARELWSRLVNTIDRIRHLMER